MSSFLDDIEAEKHAFLLEKGNLPEARQKGFFNNSRATWTGENAWVSLGYVAKINVLECQCGSKTPTLSGVFHREQSPSGAIRELSLDLSRMQIPLHADNKTEYQPFPVAACPSCISSKGFSIESSL